MKHKKTLVAILLCLVLIFSTLAFVACGENDDDAGNNNQNDADSAELDPFIENILGYLLTKSSDYANVALSGMIYSETHTISIEENGCLGSSTATLYNDKRDDGIEFSIYFFKNNEKAASYFAGLDSEYKTENNVIIDGNMIIEQTEEGLYDSIKQSTIPIGVLSDNALAFIRSNFNINIPNNLNLISFEFVTENYRESIAFSTYREFKIGNCSEECSYLKNFTDALEYVSSIRDNFTNNLYTAESYIKDEQNEVFFFAKFKPGFVFEETDGGYAIDGYYYDTESGRNAVIPDTYNEKPVIKINNNAFVDDNILSITIPNSVTTITSGAFINCRNLTNITYQGTKEQWKAISFGDHCFPYMGNVTVHCDDGYLDKDGNEI